MIRVIDTHAHLDEVDNLRDVIERAVQSGIHAIIAVGQYHTSNIKTLTIAREFKHVIYPALGLHPWYAGDTNALQIADTIQHIEKESQNISAIGEIGMDYDNRVLEKASKGMQREVFIRLLDVAVKNDKPVLVHSRYAWRDCFNLVKAAGITKAVFHWFTGPTDVLMDIVSSGYYVSATPAAEYHREHRRVIAETPLSQLMIETDSPVSYGRQTRFVSEPKDVLRSLRAIAAIKDENESMVAAAILRTTVRFFGLAGEIVRDGEISYNE